jgi:hypothetical protein
MHIGKVIGISLLVAAGLNLSTVLFAAGKKEAENKIELRDTTTTISFLEKQRGKEVTVWLASGGEITGTVAAVRRHVVRLSELKGKESSDAVISTSSIEAVIIKVRDK